MEVACMNQPRSYTDRENKLLTFVKFCGWSAVRPGLGLTAEQVICLCQECLVVAEYYGDDSDFRILFRLVLAKLYNSLSNFIEAVNCLKEILFKTAKNDNAKILACLELGKTFYSTNQYEEAISYYKKGMEIARCNGDRAFVVIACMGIGKTCLVLKQHEESISYFKKGMEMAKEVGNRKAEQHACLELGKLFYTMNQYKDCILYGKKNVQLAKAESDEEGELQGYTLLHNSYVELNQFEDAILCLKHGIELSKKNGDVHKEATAHLALGNCFYQSKQYDNSVTHLQLCCEVAENMGEKPAKMKANLTMVRAYQKLEKYDDAIVCGKKALEQAKEIEDKENEMSCCFLLGHTYQILQANNEAIGYCKRCIEISKSIGDESTEMSASFVAGAACHAIEKYNDALYYGLQCRDIALRIGAKDEECKAYAVSAKSYLDLNQTDNAMLYSKKCIKMAKEIGDKDSEVIGYLVLGELHRDRNDNDDAIYFAKEALNIAREINTKRNEMNACIIMGSAYKSKQKYDEAITYLKKTIEIAGEIGSQTTEMKAYYELGAVYMSKAEYSKAIEYSERCISTAHLVNRVGDVLVMRAHLHVAQSVAQSLNDPKRVISHSEECLRMEKELGDELYELRAYFVLAQTYHSMQEYEKATSYTDKCNYVMKKTGSKHFEIEAYSLSMFNSYGLKKHNDTIEYGRLCIKMAEERGDRNTEMAAYLLMSATYKELGKYLEAINYSTKCITLAKAVAQNLPEMKALLILADAHLSSGNFDFAISCSKNCGDLALKTGEKSIEMKALYVLSSAYINLGYYDDGISFARKSIEIAERSSDKKFEGKVCLLLANAYYLLNQHQEVIDFSKRCLTIVKETNEQSSQMKACFYAGRAYEALGKYEKALNFLEEGVNIAKELNDDNARIEFQFHIFSIHSCVGYLQENIPYGKDFFYDYYWKTMQVDSKTKIKNVTILLEKYDEYKRMGEYKLALIYLEQAIEATPCLAQLQSVLNIGKAQIYVQLDENTDLALEILEEELCTAKMKDDTPIQAECHFWLGKVNHKLDRLKEAEESYRKSIACFEFMYYHLGELEKFKISFFDRNVRCYKELSLLFIGTRQFKQALQTLDSYRARVLNDVLLTRKQLPGINSLCSGNEYTIIFYFLSDSMLYTFTSDDSGEVKLTSQNYPDCESSLKSTTEDVFEQLKVPRVPEDKAHSSPVASYESTNLPDQYFVERCNTRKEPSENIDESNLTNALEKLYHKLAHNISELVQKEEIVIIPEGPLFKIPFAALRDPVTGQYLSETKRIRLAPSIITLKLLQSCSPDYYPTSGAIIIGDPLVGKVMMDGEVKHTDSLLNARKEAQQLANILGVEALVGEEATKPVVIKKLQQWASIVHIAAHGSPTKGGAIALAPSPDIRATKIPDEEDYMLTMADVQKAQVRAQLVVLSCCHSGCGKIGAEGVVGMCRAFLASGARAVVASLWAIDDQATLEFMKHFYRYLKQGKSASTSLHLTMKDMRQSSEYSEPYYWAAFFLMGDDVTIQF